MHVHILTLVYDDTIGRIDERPLLRFLSTRRLLSLREHFFSIGNRAHFACVVTYETGANCADPSPQKQALPTNEPAEDVGARTPETPLPSKPPSPARRVDPNAMQSDDRLLFESLRAWRARRADSEGVSRFLVFTNRQLEAIALRRPASITALAEIHGIGKAKIERYGQAVLAIVENPRSPRSERAASDPSPSAELATDAATPNAGGSA